MCLLKLPVVLIVLLVALHHLKATPIERNGIVPVLSRNIKMLLETRGAKPEHEAGKAKVTKWKSGNATLPHVRPNAWQIS
uniref:Islet amyloid polypeptide n=1 Tax=Panthera tigris altaica TaxID=74533 RepID=A0A8C9JVP8_PANTA